MNLSIIILNVDKPFVFLWQCVPPLVSRDEPYSWRNSWTLFLLMPTFFLET